MNVILKDGLSTLAAIVLLLLIFSVFDRYPPIETVENHYSYREKDVKRIRFVSCRTLEKFKPINELDEDYLEKKVKCVAAIDVKEADTGLLVTYKRPFTLEKYKISGWTY